MNNKKNKSYYKKSKYHYNNYYHNKNYYYKKKKKQVKEDYIDVTNNQNNELDAEEILIKKPEFNNSFVKSNKKLAYDDLVNRYDNPKEEEKMEEKRIVVPKIVLGCVLGGLILTIVLLGSTYAFFNYNRVSEKETTIVAGDVYLNSSPSSLTLTVSKVYPRTTSEARSRTDNYIDFYINSVNTSETRVLDYWFTVSNGANIANKSRIDNDYLRFDLASLDGSNNETLILSGVDYDTFNSSTNIGLYIPVNTTTELSRKYRLRMWISEDVLISDTETGATYTQSEYNNLYASVKLIVNSTDRINVVNNPS